jgi:fumarylacetoacetate (FAA) hydrolase family protein
LLAPCDLQAVKATGVTFAGSLLERVIEERARGDAQAAQEVRRMLTDVFGGSLQGVKPGSAAAVAAKRVMMRDGMWSQYLEVGIGPDAEIFTKAQPLSAVGCGADVGVHAQSRWSSPEPEIVLAVSSAGIIVGATLGNDVTLRDFEGRSALLLTRAKDNNASCAIGPFIRMFDGRFTLDEVRAAVVRLEITGEEGFKLEGQSSMNQISRDPTELVGQTICKHHAYPDGFALFLGTMFAPIVDRGTPGQGFTHKTGDVVRVSTEKLGVLENKVTTCDQAPVWEFGIADLMRNLARRGLLNT